MSKKLKKLAAMMMALMMIALVGITASAQTEETEEQMFFGAGWDILNRITGRRLMEEDVAQAADTADEEQLRVLVVPKDAWLEEDGDQDEEQGIRDFFRDVKSGFSAGVSKVKAGFNKVKAGLDTVGEYCFQVRTAGNKDKYRPHYGGM